MKTSKPNQRLARFDDRQTAMYFVAAVALPVLTGFVVLFAWGYIEQILSSHQVDRYILNRRQWVAEGRLDPRVHELALSNVDGTLEITVDVDDKRTFVEIEDELADIYSLRLPPSWVWTVRSREKLGNDLGGMAWGIGEAAGAMIRLVVAFGGSIVSWGLVFCHMLRRSPRRKSKFSSSGDRQLVLRQS